MRLAFALSVCAAPVWAMEPMTQSDCTNGWLTITDILFDMVPFATPETEAEREAAKSVKSGVTSEGWCVIDSDQPGLEGAQFDLLYWQADGIAGFVEGQAMPSALRVRMEGFQTDDAFAEPLTVSFALQHVQDAGLLLVEDLTLRNEAGRGLAATAVIAGAYFSSVGTAVSSIGGLRLTQFESKADLWPIEGADDPTQMDGDVLRALAEVLDVGQIDEDSRAALVALADDVPNAVGQLDLSYASENGLGLFQFAAASARLDSYPDEGVAGAIAFGLSGARIGVEWRPE